MSDSITSLKIRHLGPFSRTQAERQRFCTGFLWREWAERYPQLFDADDCRIARTQAQHGLHFFEWLAAIRIYEATGYLSLIEKYEFKKHSRKQRIVKSLLPQSVLKVLSHRNRQGRVQSPDLLVYTADLSDWYFCEVKGPSDLLRKKQLDFFEKLTTVSQKPVALLEFRKCEDSF